LIADHAHRFPHPSRPGRWHLPDVCEHPRIGVRPCPDPRPCDSREGGTDRRPRCQLTVYNSLSSPPEPMTNAEIIAIARAGYDLLLQQEEDRRQAIREAVAAGTYQPTPFEVWNISDRH